MSGKMNGIHSYTTHPPPHFLPSQIEHANVTHECKKRERCCLSGVTIEAIMKQARLEVYFD